MSIGIWRRLKRDRDIGRKAVLSDVKTAFTFTPALNWSVVKLWLFISQLVEYCSANAEAMGSNPVEALKYFSG